MSVTIRMAGKSDYHLLLPLVNRYRAHMGYTGDAKEFVRDLLTRPATARVFLGIRQANPVGFLLTSESISLRVLGRAVFLEDLWVEPTCRREGIGSALLQHAADWAMRTGARTLLGVVDERERGLCEFYGRFGLMVQPRAFLQSDFSAG